MSKQILYVEGNDDLHVFSSIFAKHGLKENFACKDMKGEGNILKNLPAILKTDIQTVGIVLDADTDCVQKWKAVSALLKTAGYTPPSEPETEGTILKAKELPAFGIWLMPDNKQSGMLEDFVKHLIPAEDKLLPEADRVLSEIEAAGLNNYKEIHRSKARVHTWLAWQEDPGTPMGLAITKTYLNANHELCSKFINWINKLFA